VEVVGFWHQRRRTGGDLRHPRHLGLRQVGLGLLFVQRPTDPS
jgi:hypothetical protein